MNNIRGTDREKSLSKGAYFSNDYFSKKQWGEYAFQVRTVYECAKELKSPTILEIGKGSGVVSSVLRNMGYLVDTMDINENLEPTFVENISEISAQKIKEIHKYDIVLCAEVLEHLPFDLFEPSICNISKLLNRGGRLILTIPWGKYVIPLCFQIWKLKLQGFVRTPVPRKRKTEAHFWEVDFTKDSTQSMIMERITKYFEILKFGAVLPEKVHEVYICRKKDERLDE